MISNKLRFGVSYCPYAKSEDVAMEFWDRDFRTMKELNFNTLRCFVAWDRIEQEEGTRDFTKTDYIFELARKHGMEVILNIGGVFDCYGGIYPPRWLIYDYQCQHIVENPAVESKPFGPFRLLCPDDPVFTRKAQEFTVAAIKRYADRPELCGWNVWNEAALDHMCYCPVTLGKFREWLKVRYNHDLDRLNREWGTEFPVNYRNWEMIEPGLGAGFRAGGHVARLEWMRFNREKVTGWVNGVNDLVKQYDKSSRPTTSNIVTIAAASEDVRRLNVPDLWSQNRNLDIAGFSLYTQGSTPSDCSFMLSAVRGSSADPGKGFWILETGAGQQFNPKLYPGDCCDGANRIASHWQTVLHGGKTILLWKYGGRVTDNQTDFYNLAGWDGGITERCRSNAEFARVLTGHEKLFLDKSYRADVALLFSTDDLIFNVVDDSMGSFEKATVSRLGAYQLLRDLRLQADVVSDVQALEGRLASYRAVVIPWCESMSPALAEVISTYVRNGGTVIANRNLALKEENGRIHFRAPGHGLTEVFGGYINDMLLTALDERIEVAGGKIKLVCHRHAMIHPEDGAEVVGTYKNGTPAAVVNRCGRGRTLWFGSDLFFDYRQERDAVTATMLEKFLAEAGIVSDYEVKGGASDFEFGALTGADGEKIHFVLNMKEEEREVTFRIKSATREYRDLLSGFVYRDGAATMLPPWGVMILH